MNRSSSAAPDWTLDTVIYQIFPDRFANGDPTNDPENTVPWSSKPTRRSFHGGDLQGIIDRLPYLAALGVNCLYLTPIFAAPSNHRYDVRDYFSIDPALGTTETLKELSSSLHARGMRLLLDGVFAHVSHTFPPFQDVLEKGPDSPYAGWFMADEFPLRMRAKPNYRACGGLATMPRLNVANPEVQALIGDVGAYWINEADIDGWRLDMAWEIPDQTWQAFRQRVKGVKEDAFLLGEFWGDATPWLRGDQLDSSLNYLWRDLVFRFFVTQCIDARTFARELHALHEQYGPSAPYMVNLLGSHDTPRLATLCRKNKQKVIQTLAYLLTDLGIPLIYYGDEVGLTGGNDPGCRGSMPWDERDRGREGELSHGAGRRWDWQIYEACRELIHLRRAHPALRRGTRQVLFEKERVLVVARHFQNDTVIAAFNAGFQEEKVVVRVPAEFGKAHSEVWRSSSEVIVEKTPHDNLPNEHFELRMTLPPQGVAIMA